MKINHKDLVKKAKTILKTYIKYQNVCYSDKSNATFDLEYDALQSQVEYFYIDYEDLLYEIENDCVETGWDKHLEANMKSAKGIEAYYNAVTNSPPPYYIYG